MTEVVYSPKIKPEHLARKAIADPVTPNLAQQILEFQ